ncbi:hypothetical protein GILI108418_02950 [Gillisia limnaea]|uniref:Uncharacterized protein n=1 Tax=Gillisia limnaea (strain DSM 15749 / LMG 21470 / R-8282) TaxID=865937 RepID=H2BXK1_GILLR|nr:hypothetical protein Gilli_2501 [Gillisia limnaea DSM 15749]
MRFGEIRDMDITNQIYTIEYISETGFYEQEHLLEKVFKLHKDEIPEVLQFLNRLSLHLTEKQPISPEILEQIFNKKTYLLKVPCIKEFSI